MGLGGAQKYYGVTPDLTTLSKGVANGYPISAVVGKGDIMDAVVQTTVSATYFPSTLGISAALATIDVMEKKDVINHLWCIGRELADGLRSIVAQKKVTAHIMGESPMPFLVFGDSKNYERLWYEEIYRNGDPGTDKDRLLMYTFFNETIKRGVFFHPRHHWFTCFSHTEKDVEQTLEVADQCLDIAIKAL